MHGKGKLEYADGTVFKGDFNLDRIQGFGCYITRDGTKYVGNWVDSKLHGVGLVMHKNGESRSVEW